MSKGYSFTSAHILKYELNDDEFIDYLNKLSKLMVEEMPHMSTSLMREIVGDFGSDEEGFIPKSMGKWNYYLFTSGQNPKYWFGETSPELTTLSALYTGQDINTYFGNELPEGIWWEFAKDPSLPPKQRELDRDYAFYQETGIDTVAKPRDARHKHSIEKGLKKSKSHLKSKTAEYLEKIIKLEKINHTKTGNKTVNNIFK